jgi:multiple sugar transport system ATP-binding protein
MAKVTLKNVYKFYEKTMKPAVSDFNLEIGNNEFVVFVGPSGCGKSTTLRMIAGLERVTFGDIMIDDKVVNHIEPKNRDIAMVFQNYALYPHMSVYKNMAFGLRYIRIPKEARNANGNIIQDENGKPVFVPKTHNKLSLLLSRTPVLKYDERGNPLLDEYGNLVYATKPDRQALTRIVLTDEKGNVVFGEDGNPKYEIKRGKDGKELFNKAGQPVYFTRRYTEEEIEKGFCPPQTNSSGVVYQMRRYTKEERAALLGKPKTDFLGGIIYKTRRHTTAEIDQMVKEAAKILDIEEFFDRKPGQLSGGQRQRVAIGRSIVRKPKVFLFDEPLSNLDAKLRNQMRGEILDLRKKIATTFVYVTHDQVEAMTLGDRVVIMKDGFIQQIGTPYEVFEHPINLFVAGFIGTPQMNFFKAQLVKKDERYLVNFEGIMYDLDESVGKLFGERGEDEREIVLGVRPEHIYIQMKDNGHKEDTEDKASTVAKILVSELMGSELYMHTETAGGQHMVIRKQTAELSPDERRALTPGTSVEVLLGHHSLHLFDKETEQNLIPFDSI